MTTILIVVLAVVAASAVGLLVKSRSDRESELAQDEPPGRDRDTALALPEPEDPAIAADELVLVPLPNRRGQALVLGNHAALAELDAGGVPIAPRGAQEPDALGQLVRNAIAVGGTEATRRAQLGVDSGRIVALSEETMKQLRHGKPVFDKSQNMLGLIKGDTGKIKHVMRFDQKGAQALVASNAATLAMTVAVGQQLAAIEEKLAEIATTLGTLAHETDLHRLSEIESANESLVEIVGNIRRRGVDETDADQLNALDLTVRTNQRMAEHKFRELLGQDLKELNRAERGELIEDLAEEERLEYWLGIRVHADLARTRLDVLRLHWEIDQHPEHAREVTERVRASIEARQGRLAEIGEALRELCDPKSRTPLDPLRQLSRRRLTKESEKMQQLLQSHGEVFVAAEEHPYAVIEAPGGDLVH
jgi:hypothetical protein